MKLVWHLVVLVCVASVCASVSLSQQPGNRSGGAGLSLSANVTTASVIELSSKSEHIEEIEAKSPSLRTLKITLPTAAAADIVKQTAAGTLFLTRVEFLVRFSGFREETATVLIRLDNENSNDAFREGGTEDNLSRLAPGQVMKLQGVRSGERIVRYVGFLMDPKAEAVNQKDPCSVAITYEVVH